jgi:carboxymethylenebutenolidase
MSLVVAGAIPERVAAAGSIHGGGLVADSPASPHLLADQMTATIYVGAAENDASFTADNAATLEKALDAADVTHTIEFYQAAHGFAVPDNAPYDTEAAERHWLALQRLFESSLP